MWLFWFIYGFFILYKAINDDNNYNTNKGKEKIEIIITIMANTFTKIYRSNPSLLGESIYLGYKGNE